MLCDFFKTYSIENTCLDLTLGSNDTFWGLRSYLKIRAYMKLQADLMSILSFDFFSRNLKKILTTKSVWMLPHISLILQALAPPITRIMSNLSWKMNGTGGDRGEKRLGSKRLCVWERYSSFGFHRVLVKVNYTLTSSLSNYEKVQHLVFFFIGSKVGHTNK